MEEMVPSHNDLVLPHSAGGCGVTLRGASTRTVATKVVMCGMHTLVSKPTATRTKTWPLCPVGNNIPPSHLSCP